MVDNFQIADGHDNEAGLLSFNELSAPLFAEYVAPESIFTEWSSWMEQLLDGNLDTVDIGLPSIEAEFFYLTRAEFAYLKTLEGEVTIRALNKDGNAYANYNAKMRVITKDQKWDRNTGTGWNDVKAEFRELEAL